MNLQNLQQNEPSEPENKLSIYGKGKVTPEAWAHGTALLKGAFPKLSLDWYKTLQAMVDEDGFTDQRFKDAIMATIKNCQYPEPTLANLLNYDRYVKTFYYYELLEQSNNMDAESRKLFLSQYEEINHNKQRKYCLKEDVSKYNLEKWNKNN